MPTVGEVITTIPKLALGAGAGIINGFYDRAGSAALSPSGTGFDPSYVKDVVAKNIGMSFDDITKTNLTAQLGTLRSAGFQGWIDNVFNALKATKWRGLVLCGGVVGALALTAILGWKVFSQARRAVDEIDQGHFAHLINSKLFHTALYGLGIGMMASLPALLFAPQIALPLGIACGVGALGMSTISKLIYSPSAPWNTPANMPVEARGIVRGLHQWLV